MKSIETPSGAIWCHPRMYPKTSEPNVRRCNDRPLKLHPSFAETPPLIAGHSLSAWKARLHTPWSEMPHERNIKDITYHSLHLHYNSLHHITSMCELTWDLNRFWNQPSLPQEEPIVFHLNIILQRLAIALIYFDLLENAAPTLG